MLILVFSSVWVAELPSFGKELLTRLAICHFVFLLFVTIVISRFGFKGGNWVMIAQVPGLCILVTFKPSKKEKL